MPITVSIDASITAAWPDARLGCLFYRVAVRRECPELWRHYELEIAEAMRQRLDRTALADMPEIGAARAAYKAFGADPGKHRVSSEALYRRIRQGKSLYRINSLVDANNLVSVETGFSLGSYDTARLGPDIVFRLGKPGECYAGIGKSDISLERLPVLADGNGPFGSPTSDSRRAMITTETKEAMTIIFSFSGAAALAPALEKAGEHLRRFAGMEAPSVLTV